MSFSEFLSLVRRRWLTVAVVTLAVVIAAVGLNFLRPTESTATLLFSVGVADEPTNEKTFDATKLADDFAHSIAGWTRSPDFAQKIGDSAGVPVGLSGAAQEKQNFYLTLSFPLASDGDRVVAAAKKVLAEKIRAYSADSKFKFFTVLVGDSHGTSGGNLKLSVAAGFAGGLALALAWLAVSAAFGGRVNSTSEAEKILGVSAAVEFCSPRKKNRHFLDTLVKKLGGATVVGVDFDAKKIFSRDHEKIKTAALPDDAEILAKKEKLIVIVRLDRTRESTLRQTAALASDKLALAVWNG